MASISVVSQAPHVDHLGWQILGAGERLASAFLFTALSPVMAASAAAVSLISGRAPLIAHRRVGWRGSTLWMLKLRTMWEDGGTGLRHGSRWIEYIDDGAGPRLKQAGDPRVTSRFARFCRRHSIDELPQLWHVLRGEMSLVGPRPLTDVELRRYYGTDAWEVLQVKPGMAGLWQISGRGRLTYEQRRKLDLDLVRGQSVRRYLGILLRAIPLILRGANSW